MNKFVLGTAIIALTVAGSARAQKPSDGAGKGKGPRGPMMMTDYNEDGIISQSEFDQTMADMFARMDADGNGLVTTSERDAAREKM